MSRLLFTNLLLCILLISPRSVAQTLEKTLGEESVDRLIRDVLRMGDARRGAIVFHQPSMACSRCHDLSGAGPAHLGPDLTAWQKKPSDQDMIESVLQPSKVIRRGYETIQVVTVQGKVVSGLLHSDQNQVLTLREVLSGRLIPIMADEIEERRQTLISTMPAGQVSQLTSRQQFLDLMKYLYEVRDGGGARATELQPPSSMFALSIPEYESHVDHAGLISDFDDESFQRGEAIYNRLCINCHGDLETPGSLPTALRFGEGRFKSVRDPYGMYRTLTNGFGFMVAQTWMVPRQKYDVIHYIREAYLREHNPSQYISINNEYLDELPVGDTRGPEPTLMDQYATMDYGPGLINTYEIGTDGSNFAYKGIAVRLDQGPGGVARGSAWMIFDHDTMRMAAAWTADPQESGDRFIDWNGIHFNGRHRVHPRIVGDLQVANPTGPGWAHPDTESLEDTERVIGRDRRPYGPLPRDWARYRGLYTAGDRMIIHYTVGTTSVMEMPGMVTAGDPGTPTLFSRTFNVGRRRRNLTLVVGTCSDVSASFESGTDWASLLPAPEPHADRTEGRNSDLEIRSGTTQVQQGTGVMAGLSTQVDGTQWSHQSGRLCLTIPKGDQPLNFVLWFTRMQPEVRFVDFPSIETSPDLLSVAASGHALWKEEITTVVTPGDDDGPFAVDRLTSPENNPWLAQIRPTGLDFLDDGDRLAVCTWDGDVWLVRGLKELRETATLNWKRIASGLFQPLGLKLIDGRIFVACRDQIVVLEDRNGDGETDYYRSFNSDHQVTEHFHEFAMGLQTDDDGNLYYAKSARHAKTALVPHHGTLLRVSADGERTDILANGFRAANGVCLNQDGSFVVTDQEGHWNPKNRINWVREGGFYGNMFGYHDVTDSSDSAMEQPLCWITNEFDRSPGELLWVDSESWGPLNGSLLNLSYGYGKVYVVPFEELDGQPQGGMCELPISQFPTGTMRGRFNPADGHLYTCGMVAWGSSQTDSGGLYRLRATGKPSWLPCGLTTHADGVSIEFTDALHVTAAESPENYRIKVWSLRRTANYGSEHYDEHPLEIRSAALSGDGRTVRLSVPEIAPTWCMEIRCQVKTPDGGTEERVIHNTIHRLNE
ncbi:MAG: c-type cytochrome [Fuerstiella sp.]|nr:c-type cytochrome [Fuerstiella sp.]